MSPDLLELFTWKRARRALRYGTHKGRTMPKARHAVKREFVSKCNAFAVEREHDAELFEIERAAYRGALRGALTDETRLEIGRLCGVTLDRGRDYEN